MAKFKILTFSFFLLTFSIFSCSSENENSTSGSKLEEVKKIEVITPKKKNIIFEIKGEDIILREGPGEDFNKIINKKASKALNITHYIKIDYTTKVKKLEAKSSWSKIQVISPSHLSKTHIGWIESKYLVSPDKDIFISTLEDFQYEIIKTNHKSLVENFHILFSDSNFNKEILSEFTKVFRKNKCSKDCNISIYDSKKILDLIGKYPLNNSQYLKMAEHLLSISSFDAPKHKSWYPYQDTKYKTLGGKNWKKEPIK